MEKRLPIFLLLSFLVLVFWPRPTPPETEAGVVDDLPLPVLPDDGFAEEVPAAELGSDEPPPWRETLLLGRPGERGHYQATFDNRGGSLCELRLDGYFLDLELDAAAKADPAHWVPLVTEVDNRRGVACSLALRALGAAEAIAGAPLERVRWRHEVLRDDDGVALGVRFEHDPGTGVRFVKKVQVLPGTYDLAVELEVHNDDAALAGRSAGFVFTPAVGVPPSSNDKYYTEPTADVCWRKGRKLKIARQARIHDELREEAFPPREDIAWAGVDSKFFAILLRPIEATGSVVVGAGWRTLYDEDWSAAHPGKERQGYRHVVADVDLHVPLPEQGGVSRLLFRLYAGPKDEAILRAHDEAFEQLVVHDLGFFHGIASVLLSILNFFHGLSGNWGWSIILLTLFVRLALFPFNRRSQTTLARHATKMKRIQPKIDEVKERYKKDPQKLRQEQARIMQEEGAFPPLGGCLPVFVQIPIFFGLFKALRISFDLRQAPFLGWIEDLSEPDRFLRIDLHVPLLGTIEYLNVLPPLMVVLWILQQKVMPKPTDPQAARMQKMMMWMPILFGFFLYDYAAGLSLYMITTSAFGILEQTVIKKIWPLDDTEQPRKKGGFMKRLAELSEQAQKMQDMQRQARSQHDAQHRRRVKGGAGARAGGGKARRRR